MRFLATLDPTDTDVCNHFWELHAAQHQEQPPGDWTTWLFLGGRGAGKTRAGAEWVKQIARYEPKQSPIALIGETEHDAREVRLRG